MMQVSLDQASLFCLQRQHLLERAPPGELIRVVDSACGLQAQLKTAPGISLLSRIEGFDRDLLEGALYENKSLVKVWCMRGTLHVIPSKELPLYHQATKESWLEYRRKALSKRDWLPLEERRRQIHPLAIKALEDGILERATLASRVRAEVGPEVAEQISDYSLVKELCYSGLVVPALPKKGRPTLARLEGWLPGIDPEGVGTVEARKALLRKYMSGYGPVSLGDFARWIGLRVGDVRPTLDSMGDEVAEVKVPALGLRKQFYVLREDVEVLQGIDTEGLKVVRLLPNFDSLILAHKDKERFTDPHFIDRVFLAAGNVAATVMVDGRVEATWKYRKGKRKVIVDVYPFEELPQHAVGMVELEASRLARYLNLEEFELRISA